MNSASGYDLSLLGCWQLKFRGQPLCVAPRQRRLISALALRGTRSRHYMADLLWPESSEVQAAGSLRASVFRISHQLPMLLGGGLDPLRLDEDVDVDLHKVQDLIGSIGDGDAPPCGGIDVLRDAELLPGWYEDWVLFEQEHLQIQRLSALETMARQYLGQGDIWRALEAATAAATIEPFRESARLIMVRAHLAEDNYASAVHVYENFRRDILRELGVEPSSSFRELLGMHPSGASRAAPRQMLR